MDTPDISYGRLLGFLDVSSYSAERAVQDLKHLLVTKDWKKVGNGYEYIDDFVNGLSLASYNIGISDRKEINKLLADESASKKAAARMLGVDAKTVRNDLREDNSPLDKISKNNVLQDKELKSPKIAWEDKSPPIEAEIKQEDTQARPELKPQKTGAELVRKEQLKADKALVYGHDQGDEWYTPKWIFDSLGLRFSIDVCSPVDLTHVTTPADKYYNEETDGLNQEWEGTVWCNPPYSDPAAWAAKMIKHNDGLFLTHIPMNAGWCADIWQACSGIRLFQAIEFVRPDGNKQRPGMWLQLSAFGSIAREALKNMVIPDDVAENPRRVPSPMWFKDE